MKNFPFKFAPLFTLSTSLALVLLSGCATSAPTISSHADTSVAYSHYRTFMILRPANMLASPNPAATPVLVRTVRQQTEAAFMEKGLFKSIDGTADLFVHVHGGLTERLDIQDWGLSYGRFGHAYAGRQEITSSRQGSLFIDVFDAKTRELVWTGSAMADISDSPDQEKVKSAVAAIVARYPN